VVFAAIRWGIIVYVGPAARGSRAVRKFA